jgi:hypothetical protein
MLDLVVGDFRRLGLEPQMAGRRHEPAPERLIAMPLKACWKAQRLYRTRRQARGARQGFERLTQP